MSYLFVALVYVLFGLRLGLNVMMHRVVDVSVLLIQLRFFGFQLVFAHLIKVNATLIVNMLAIQ
jgi:hypothetical protein